LLTAHSFAAVNFSVIAACFAGSAPFRSDVLFAGRRVFLLMRHSFTGKSFLLKKPSLQGRPQFAAVFLLTGQALFADQQSAVVRNNGERASFSAGLICMATQTLLERNIDGRHKVVLLMSVKRGGARNVPSFGPAISKSLFLRAPR